MKKFKPVITMILIFTILLPGSAFATVDASQSGSGGAYKEAKHEVINLLEDAEVSKPMTYEEMIRSYAQKSGKSLSEVMNAEMKNNGMISPQSVLYREFSVQLEVTSTYKPKIIFYCQCSGVTGGSHWKIDNIYDVVLYREYNGISKQFAGKLNYWLRSGPQIEYIIDGDFYNNGTTTFSGGGTVTVGEKGTINFGVSVSSNHYKYFNEHGFRKIVTG